MDVFLTGGTGYIGSSLLPALQRAGHTVTALARSDGSAAALEAVGATVIRGSLTDATVLTDAARAAGAVIHTASPGDASSDEADNTAATAFLAALSGSHKPYLHTGGVWVHGSSAGVIDETAPFNPPALTAWRLPIAERVLAGVADGVNAVIVAPGIVYGHGGGLPTLLLGGPQRDGKLLFPGSGDQHWTTIHVDDLAELYVAALAAEPGTYVFGASGSNPTVRELAEAAAATLGLQGAASEPAEETAARLGPLAEALELDQQATGDKARSLGWEPKRPTLIKELTSGSYASE